MHNCTYVYTYEHINDFSHSAFIVYCNEYVYHSMIQRGQEIFYFVAITQYQNKRGVVSNQ